MSFSSDIKDELCRLHNEKPCCAFHELAGILRTGLIIREIGKKNHLLFITEHASVSRTVYSRVKEMVPDGVEISGEKTTRFKRHMVYRLDFTGITERNDGIRLLDSVGMNVNLPQQKVEYTKLDIKNKCCIRAYLRGGFLAVGSVSNPDKSYHIELSFINGLIADEFMSYMEFFELKPRIIQRKNYDIVYMKEGQDIVDFLNVINAHNALLEMENIRILKDMRNQVNRIVNCETANLEKTVNASLKQVSYIKYIDERIGIENLPEGLKEIARLRMENPEASLSELGKMLKPELGKSGVNHRMRKLQQIATDLMEKGK
ncbi:transcriptional regulator [Thermoclostridium stercorarium subsp. leptospartum DSM 9219]|uniref:Probable cell division protein WhiA n=1 Tax=Thermoclostridium stercorarium subsp. leptospartum DSM 9219 TaxID=1346611 RepID=A0A1B1YKG9_THEST|nr:DNA-binding protein WhiA [Thermoclostridium stercorarium]ANX01279.1 transcriptional regulator [Thermoclostridium stercorarium subsp. leptospartum DSM 9219]